MTTKQQNKPALKKHPVKGKNKKLRIKLILAFIVLFAILFSFFLKGEKSFAYKREVALEKSGITYRSFVFTEFNEENKKNPYPVLDKSTGKYYYKSSENKKLCAPIYDDARLSTGFFINNSTTKSYIAAVKQGEKWGYILFKENENKKLAVGEGFLIEPVYDNAEPFYNGVAAVMIDGEYNCISPDGKKLFNKHYDIIKYYSQGLFPVKQNGQWYYIDITEKLCLGPYEEAESFSEDYACVKLNDNWGIIKKDGSFAADPEYADIWSVSEGVFHANNGQHWKEYEIGN